MAIVAYGYGLNQGLVDVKGTVFIDGVRATLDAQQLAATLDDGLVATLDTVELEATLDDGGLEVDLCVEAPSQPLVFTHTMTLGQGASDEYGFFFGSFGSLSPVTVGGISPEVNVGLGRFLVPPVNPIQVRPDGNPPAGSTLNIEFRNFPAFSLQVEPPGLFWQGHVSSPAPSPNALWHYLDAIGAGNTVDVNLTITP